MGWAKRLSGGTLTLCGALALAACANDRGPHPNLPMLGVLVEFTSRNLCGLGVSPEVRLGNVPANSAIYRVRITEVSTLTSPRWQADLPARGAVIPEGTMTGFDVPCPGEKQELFYRFEVMALASDTTPLAYGWGFSSTVVALPRQIENEQRLAKRGKQAITAPPSRPPNFFVQ